MITVTGKSWKDHEYSTSALSQGAVGWDWFSLQMDNGAALMFFQIRNADGSLERYSSGSFIAPDGTVIRERDLQHTDPSFGYPDNTFHVMTVHWAIRAMDLKPKNVVRVWVWLDFTVVYPLIISVEGEERIKVDAGEFDCWRVEVQLDKKGINDLMGAIIARSQSRYIFWIEKGGTHGVVRLSWPISSGLLGRSARYQTQDLVRVTK